MKENYDFPFPLLTKPKLKKVLQPSHHHHHYHHPSHQLYYLLLQSSRHYHTLPYHQRRQSLRPLFSQCDLAVGHSLLRQDTLISPLSCHHDFTVRFDHTLWSIITITSFLALSAILFSKHTPTPTHSCCYNPLHCTLLFLLLFLLFLFLLCRLSPFYLYFLYFLLDQSFSLGKGWRLPPPHKHTFSLYFSSLNVYFTVTNLEDDGDGYVYDYELIIIIIHETYLYNTHTPIHSVR